MFRLFLRMQVTEFDNSYVTLLPLARALDFNDSLTLYGENVGLNDENFIEVSLLMRWISCVDFDTEGKFFESENVWNEG